MAIEKQQLSVRKEANLFTLANQNDCTCAPAFRKEAPDHVIVRYALLQEQLIVLQGTGPLNKLQRKHLKQTMHSLRVVYPSVESRASETVEPILLGTGGGELLPYEKEFVTRGIMQNVTHPGSSSVWLVAESKACISAGHTLVYRPMADRELSYLMETGNLPATQPYQAIIEGENGRTYAEKYLKGHKKVDTISGEGGAGGAHVVEFCAPRSMIEGLFEIQSKVEDGAMSSGLGDKAGKGLPVFNASLASRETTWRIVTTKRKIPQSKIKRKR
jgi:hypothetical protein